jgi:hypothetical protein
VYVGGSPQSVEIVAFGVYVIENIIVGEHVLKTLFFFAKRLNSQAVTVEAETADDTCACA